MIHTVGIDLGLSGAITVLKNRKIVQLIDMPTLKFKSGSGERTVLDVAAVRKLLVRIRRRFSSASFFVEKVHPIGSRRVSPQANWNLGNAEGAFQGLFEGLGLPYCFVEAKKWQQHFEISGKHRGEVAPSYAVAKRLYPRAKLVGKRGGIFDGRCDSILIALWGLECGGNGWRKEVLDRRDGNRLRNERYGARS